MKQCRKCHQTKPLTEYYKATSRTADGYRHECKACWASACKSYYESNKDDLAPKRKEYYYQYRYGVRVADFEKMKAASDFKCEACGQEKTLVLDHCPTSGKPRGVLCNPCNQALGSLYENEQYTLGLLEYLRKHTKELT